MTTTASETLEFRGDDLASCEDHLNFLADNNTLDSVILQITDPQTRQVLTDITHVPVSAHDEPCPYAPTFTDYGDYTVVDYTDVDGYNERAIIPHTMTVTAVVTEYVDEEDADETAHDDTAQESNNTTTTPTFDDVTAFLTGYIGAHTEHVRDYAYDLRDITADVGTSVLRNVAGTMRDTLHTIADVVDDRVTSDAQPNDDTEDNNADNDADDNAADIDWSAYDAFEDDCTQLHDHAITTVHITVDGTDTEDVFPITVTIAGEKHAITADDLDEYGYADIEVITARIAD